MEGEQVEVDILDRDKISPKEFADIVIRYTKPTETKKVRQNIVAVRGEGFVHLFWNSSCEHNNLSFDDCQVPKDFWEDDAIRVLISHIMSLTPSKLVIVYLENDCERYLKQDIPKDLNFEKVKFKLGNDAFLIG